MTGDRDDGCRCYRKIAFNDERAETIRLIRTVFDEYAAAGLMLTVRQVFYQFIARGWARPHPTLYPRIQSAVNDGRLAGLLPWTTLEDRGRGLRGLRTQRSPAHAIRAARREYRLDLWAHQEWRPEFWVEKQALEGVIGDIATEMRVDFYATKGYDSQSQQWRAGQRLAGYVRKGQRPIVFHMGDHDPSGVDMTRDVRERLEMFAGVPITVERIALNMPQVQKYDPPPFAVKMTDSRGLAYKRRFGSKAWELDALDPRVLRSLMEDAVRMIRDDKIWEAALAEEVGDLREMDDIVESLGEPETED